MSLANNFREDIRPGNRLYRGVRCPTRPEQLERISYPPPDRVTQLGRVNRPRQSVFYCSIGAPAVFYELRAKPGDLVALSEWELVEPLWMHNLGYHPHALQRIQAPAHVMRPQLTDPIPNETPVNAPPKLHVGSLIARGDVPVALGAKQVVSRHLAILAMTGGGKTVAARRIIRAPRSALSPNPLSERMGEFRLVGRVHRHLGAPQRLGTAGAIPAGTEMGDHGIVAAHQPI